MGRLRRFYELSEWATSMGVMLPPLLGGLVLGAIASALISGTVGAIVCLAVWLWGWLARIITDRPPADPS